MADLWHSWGNSPKQKAREKEYNHWYYEKFKDKILKKRKGPSLSWHELNYNDPEKGRYDGWIFRQGGQLGKTDDGSYDRSVGVRYLFSDKRNEIAVFDTKHEYWDDKAWKIKIGDVTYQRAEDGVNISLNLNGAKQLTRLGDSIINTGKSIINKLRGGR